MKWSLKVKYFNLYQILPPTTSREMYGDFSGEERFQGIQKLTLQMLSTGTMRDEDQNLKSNLLTQSVRKNVLRKLTYFVPPIHTVKKTQCCFIYRSKKAWYTLLRSSTKPSFFLRCSLYLVPVSLCILLPRWIFWGGANASPERLLGRL